MAVHWLVTSFQSYEIQTGGKSLLLVSPKRRPNDNLGQKENSVTEVSSLRCGPGAGASHAKLSVKIQGGLRVPVRLLWSFTGERPWGAELLHLISLGVSHEGWTSFQVLSSWCVYSNLNVRTQYREEVGTVQARQTCVSKVELTSPSTQRSQKSLTEHEELHRCFFNLKMPSYGG
jgi:hypothetical protein